MILEKKELQLLDCTLRDGGYYNNWNFSKDLINFYLKAISKTPMEYVELGFRSLDKVKTKGNTAYTDDKLISQLIIPKKLKIGVMINASDIIGSDLSQVNFCKKIFPKINNINFVRLACHVHEIYEIKQAIEWLKGNGFLVTVNIMQISEIKLFQIKKICKFLSKLGVDILYMADSLGSLKPNDFKKITKNFKKYWANELGVHAHNNLGLALKNSISAHKNGAKWVDATVSGMGRGPGNVVTEQLLQYLKKEFKIDINFRHLLKLKEKYFMILKKKYNWGPNKYYSFAAKHKIHPTYIQEILSDKRYKKKNYTEILNDLDLSGNKKFNPHKLLTPQSVFVGKPRGVWHPKDTIKNKNVIIIGPGSSVWKVKNKIERLIKKNNFFVISLNTAKNINNTLINLRSACHPLRIYSDIYFHNKSNNNLALPLSMLPKKLRTLVAKNNKNFFDYGMAVHSKDSIIIKDKFCILPKPLVIAYSIAISISGKANNIFLAGVDGYKKDDPSNDDTSHILKIFKEKYKKINIRSLTPTNYKIPLISPKHFI